MILDRSKKVKIVIQPTAGAPLFAVERDAARLALEEMLPVEFTFNGELYRASPSPQLLVEGVAREFAINADDDV